MSQIQFSLPFSESPTTQSTSTQLSDLLAQELDFHNQNVTYASHNFHSFPAKFPPQLPRHFIDGLTNAGDVVLDPMQGSGTTTLEALLTGRQAIGTDIDPLALLIASVKTTQHDPQFTLPKNYLQI
jgi:DNA modification methylase